LKKLDPIPGAAAAVAEADLHVAAAVAVAEADLHVAAAVAVAEAAAGVHR